MPIDSSIPLRANAQIDPSQGLNALASAYQYRNQQNRQLKLDSERTEDRAQQRELQSLQLANEKFKSLDDREQRRTRNNVLAAAELNPFLESDDKEGAMSWAQNRRQRIIDAKSVDPTLDTTNTDNVIGLMQKGEWDTLKKHNDTAIKLGQALKFLTPTETKLLSPAEEAQQIRLLGAKEPTKLLTPEEEAQKMRIQAAGRSSAPPRQPIAYDPGTGTYVWGTIDDARGKPAGNFNPALQGSIAGAKETAKAEVGMNTDAAKAVKGSDKLLAVAKEAETLLDNNTTQSGIGAGVDAAGRLVGVSTASSQNAAKLETLSGWMTANVPRMEGPQSNFDVDNYKIMAAKVGDRTVPVAERKQALKTLVVLQEKYKNLNQTRRATDAKPAGGQVKFLGFEK